MSGKIPKLEGRVFAWVMAVVAVHLILIAYAAVKLGVTVPTCVTPESAMFQPALIKQADKQYELHIKAHMWAFEPSYIKLPVGSELNIFLFSQDVLHGMHVNGTNINLMAVPGAIANIKQVFHRPGKYEIVCHEYCGVGHQNMSGMIEVVAADEEAEAKGLVLASLEDMKKGATLAPAADDSPGKKLAQNKACLGCHSVDGTPLVGPSFKGLFGKEEHILVNGEKKLVHVDEEYLRKTILDPQWKLVEGYTPTMPKIPLTPEEVDTLISFIKEQR